MPPSIALLCYSSLPEPQRRRLQHLEFTKTWQRFGTKEALTAGTVASGEILIRVEA